MEHLNTLQKVSDFKVSLLIELLKQCTDEQQLLFKRMYSASNLETPIEQVVVNLSPEKYEWAVKQVENTLIKNTETVTL